MFYKCASLKEFTIISEEKINFDNEYKKENKNNQLKETKTENSFYSNNKIEEINKPFNDVFNNYEYNAMNPNSISEIKSSDNNESKSLYSYYYSILTNNEKNIMATDLSYMFYGCSSLLSITGLARINTSNVIDMAHMFDKCSSLKIIDDISQWDISMVNDISYLFSGCSLLKSLPDISNWNTKEIKSMIGLFYNCCSLLFLPDISKWNTCNVINMCGLFYNCSNIKTLPDISKFNLINVKYLAQVFSNCSLLLSLPHSLNGILKV